MQRADEKSDRRLRLSGGRQLGFAEYGDPEGNLVFYFHGWPGSRYEPRLLHSVCAELHLRLLAPDRPGLGLSDFQGGRALLDWPKDVCELAEHFGVFRFAVLGVSGGGPYGLACAAAVPERLRSLVLVSSLGPLRSPEALEGMVALHRWLLELVRRVPWLANRVACLCMRVFWGRGQHAIPPSVEKRLCAQDRLALQSRDLRETLIASSLEAFRQGTRGPALDGLLLARPWGFHLEELEARVQLWHGEADVVIPPAMGRCLARLLRRGESRFCPQEGHFSLLYNHAPEILRALAA